MFCNPSFTSLFGSNKGLHRGLEPGTDPLHQVLLHEAGCLVQLSIETKKRTVPDVPNSNFDRILGGFTVLGGPVFHGTPYVATGGPTRTMETTEKLYRSKTN